jgi:hypothetical protein
MSIPAKSRWSVASSSGDPRLAVDGNYATRWVCGPTPDPWFLIDLGETAVLGGLEIYWGSHPAWIYSFERSLDGVAWSPLCATRHGEGGLNVFAFPAVVARFVRWKEDVPNRGQERDVVEFNLYAPTQAASVREAGRIAALGRAPVLLPVGDSITVDLGYSRISLGVLIDWGEAYGIDMSVHVSDDGESFRETGRITNGDGDYDSFYWRTASCRYVRFTLHRASAPTGAEILELKLRILDKDRMPIGRLEHAAKTGRSELYPQALSGRQVYWTALGEIGHGNEAIFDEYGNLEAQPGCGQLTPLLRVGGKLHGAPGSPEISQGLLDGFLPIPTVTWSAEEIELKITAIARAGEALLEYRVTNRSAAPQHFALVLVVHPVQVNSYWQHGGHAPIEAIVVEGKRVKVNDRNYVAFSRDPDVTTIAEFRDGDVVSLVETAPRPTDLSLRSDSRLLSAAFQFDLRLAGNDSIALVASAPLQDDVTPNAEIDFPGAHDAVADHWRATIGCPRIVLGDREVADTVAAQTGFILVNATQFALKPGPRNYDRTWIRDGSAQALALLYAGLFEQAKAYVLWYSERIYSNGMVPPILDKDGSVNRGYGSDIEFDAQGEFVAIAAETYRFTRDRAFLEAIFEPVVRATRFIEVLCARTNAIYGPETRFYGLLAPSISHEGYSKPTYSYWDDFFALRAWRDCAYLASEFGDESAVAEAVAKGKSFATNLARSLRMAATAMGSGVIPASADREDFDPTSTSIAFEPCRVDDVLPAELVMPTYDRYRAHLDARRGPGFAGSFTPYEIRNLNAFVSLGRTEEAFRLLADALSWRRPSGWRQWAEVVWDDPRAPEYIGDMPHTWIGAEFATAIRRMLLRENGCILELFRAVPDRWWDGEGIALRDVPTHFGKVDLVARRTATRATIDLVSSGPAPEIVTIRYPAAKQATADGRPCHIDRGLITAVNPGRIVIEA